MKTPLEGQLHDALHGRVDTLDRSPLSFTDVRHRARRIRRRRAVAAGAGIVAVLALLVPAGLAINGPDRRTLLPPSTQTPPAVTGTVRVDPRSADVGDAPGVPLVDTTGPTLVMGDVSLDLSRAYDQVTPYRDGWIALAKVDGIGTIDVLDASLGVVEETTNSSSGLTVSSDGTRVAWAFHDGDHWSITNSDVAGDEAERPWTTLPEGPYASEAGTIGFVSPDEVLAFQLDQGDGTITSFLADGLAIVELPWIDQAASASPTTGMIAARATVDDGRSCGAVFDGRTRSPEPLWTDCDRTMSDFNPDGNLLAAFPDGDQASDGNPRGLSILDATTGASLVDFEVTPTRGRPVGIATRIAWEDDQTLLATYVDGNQQYVVRLGLDGTVERVAGPVTNDDYTLSYRLSSASVD